MPKKVSFEENRMLYHRKRKGNKPSVMIRLLLKTGLVKSQRQAKKLLLLLALILLVVAGGHFYFTNIAPNQTDTVYYEDIPPELLEQIPPEKRDEIPRRN